MTQKGKVLADSFVIRGGEEAFFVGSYACSAEKIRDRLEAYLIADEVEIEDLTSDRRGLTLFTESARDELAALIPGGVIFEGRRGGGKHWEILLPADAMEKVSEQLDPAAKLTEEAMELRRITGGVPAIPRDLDESDLPNEGGLDRDAVSYTKGCYLGQEVMARLKAMGQVRRRLHQISGEGDAPAMPATLYAGDRKVGELRSVVKRDNGFVGLAMLSLMYLPDDKKLAMEAGTGGMISVHEPV